MKQSGTPYEQRPCAILVHTLFRHLRPKTRSHLRLIAIGIFTMFCISTVCGEELPPPIEAAPKPKESQESTTWVEPSMFPHDTEIATMPLSETRERRIETQTASIETSLSDSAYDSQHAASAFQSNFGDRGYDGRPATGLESERERDAMFARSQRNISDQSYNIKIGPLPLRLSAGLDANFSDNSERSNLNKTTELTLLPRIDISGSVRLSSFASLSLGLGIGYVKYLNHSENDRVLPLAVASLNPESGISFNIKIGKFLITVFDRPQVPQFQADAVTQRNQSQYQQFTNAAGVSILWDTNSRSSVTFRYTHSDSISFGSNVSTSDNSANDFLTSLSCKLGDSLGVGLEAGLSKTKYKETFLNGNTTYHAGPFLSLRLSEFLRLQASAGYQGGNYESGGGVGDNSSLGTYYANVSFSNNLNPRFNHYLSFGRESQSGAFSNFTLVNYVRYQANWDVIRIANLSFYASFEDVEESGGLFAQHLRNYSIGVQSAFQLTKHISISLAYEFAKREATDDPTPLGGSELDFDENRVSIRLGYTF